MTEKEAVSLRFETDFKKVGRVQESSREKVAEIKDRGVSSMLRAIPAKIDIVKIKF